MKLTLVGSQGSGKTTLAETLAIAMEWKYFPECARDVLKKYDVKNEDHQSELQGIQRTLAIQKDILAEKRKIWTQWHYDSVVADRCQVDALAYLTFWASREKEAAALFAEVEEEVKWEKNKWDAVILVPPLDFIENDGVRSVNPTYQRHIHRLILGILQDHKYNYFELQGKTVPARLKECKTIINHITMMKGEHGSGIN